MVLASSRASSRRMALALLGLTLPACSGQVDAMPVAAAPVEVPATTPVTVTGTPWTTDAPPSAVPEMKGTPLVMAAGARCTSYRALPTLRFTESTLVQDACLQIPAGTVIEMRDGVSLAIVATNGLSIGRNVRFNGQGTRGRRGRRADYASIVSPVNTEAEIKAICIDKSVECACPKGEASLAAIRGHDGESGLAGGTLYLVAPEFSAPGNLGGFGADLTGGSGGPPGESGKQECSHGAVRCASPACAEGVKNGAPGANGSVIVTLGSPNPVPAPLMNVLKGAIIPPEAFVDAPLEAGAVIKKRVTELTDQAIQQGWQRRSGEE